MRAGDVMWPGIRPHGLSDSLPSVCVQYQEAIFIIDFGGGINAASLPCVNFYTNPSSTRYRYSFRQRLSNVWLYDLQSTFKALTFQEREKSMPVI